MAYSDFPYFRLHSGWAEQNWDGARTPDGVEQLSGAVGMIAVYHDGIEGQSRYHFVDRLLLSQEYRLQTTKLNHETQQRSDDLFARENQHIAQRRQPKEGTRLSWATYGPFGLSGADTEYRLNISGTNVHFPQTSEKVDKTIAQETVSPLSEVTMKELRTALADQLKWPDGPTPELADLLKRVGKEAHTNNIPPEELIVIFKELWNSLAEALRPQNADQYERVRQRLVTLCIQAYYAE